MGAVAARLEPDASAVGHATSTMASISIEIPSGKLGMPTAERACRPRSPKTFDEQIRATIDYFGMLPESGHRVDHAQHLDDPHDPVELAEFCLHGRDQLQTSYTRVLISFLDGDVTPE